MSFSVGGVPVGSPREGVNQSVQEVAKKDTMLVKDTLEVPLTKMQGDIYQYRQPETKPLLPMYLQVFLNRQDRPPETWPKAFKELAQRLPNELKAFMKRESQKPSHERDPSYESIKKSLEFAAKGLDWLRSSAKVEVKIDDEERKKNETSQAKESLDFYREIFQACTTVAKRLSALRPEREYLLQMSVRIPKVIGAIGQKREKVSKQAALTLDDEAIIKETEALKSYLDKSLGEKRPLITTMLVDQLELLHQLSYPELDKRLFKMLWYQGKLSKVDVSALKRMLGQLRLLSDEIAKRGAFAPLAAESSTYLGELLLVFFYGLERSEKKKDFTFFLTLSLMIGSTFLKTLGKELMRALLVDEKAQEWMSSLLLGLSSAMLFTHMKGSSDCLEIVKPILATALNDTAKYCENEAGVTAFCQRALQALDDPDTLMSLIEELNLNPVEIEKARKGLEELARIFEQSLVEAGISFSAQSA